MSLCMSWLWIEDCTQMMRLVLAFGSEGGIVGWKEGFAMGVPRRRQRRRSMALREVQALDWRVRRMMRALFWPEFASFWSWTRVFVDEDNLRRSAKAMARRTISQPFLGRPMNFWLCVSG